MVFFTGKLTYKWFMFHCHVSLPEGSLALLFKRWVWSLFVLWTGQVWTSRCCVVMFMWAKHGKTMSQTIHDNGKLKKHTTYKNVKTYLKNGGDWGMVYCYPQ